MLYFIFIRQADFTVFNINEKFEKMELRLDLCKPKKLESFDHRHINDFLFFH